MSSRLRHLLLACIVLACAGVGLVVAWGTWDTEGSLEEVYKRALVGIVCGLIVGCALGTVASTLVKRRRGRAVGFDQQGFRR